MPADEAAALLDEALVVFRQADDVLGIARAEATYVLLLDWNTRPDAALVHAERADAAYRSLGRRGQMDATAVLLAVRGTTTVREATRACERSLAGHPDSPRAARVPPRLPRSPPRPERRQGRGRRGRGRRPVASAGAR